MVDRVAYFINFFVKTLLISASMQYGCEIFRILFSKK